ASMAWSMTRPSVRSRRPSSRPPGARMTCFARLRLSAFAGISTSVASQYLVFKGGEFTPDARLAFQVDRADRGALAGRQYVHDAAPAIHHHAVAVCATTVFMLADLRRNHKVTEVFHGASTHQQVPVRLAGRDGERCRHDEIL